LRQDSIVRATRDAPRRHPAGDCGLVGFERRVTIAFHVDPTTVTIDRILYGGREIEAHSRAALTRQYLPPAGMPST